MVLMISSMILWILILIFNAFYSFFPSQLQNIRWVKIAAMAAATLILIGGIAQEIQKYRAYRFAYVRANDGAVLKRKNFPWHIAKGIKREDGKTVYIVTSRYGDASDITVKLDKPVQYEIYNAMDGVAVKFLCAEAAIPNFKIIIKD